MHKCGSEARLIGPEEFLERYPAFRSKGKNPLYRLQWLTRSRQVPIVKIGRRIYYDVQEVEAWLESQKIPAVKEGAE